MCVVELRRYMGPRYAEIPRGAVVKVLKKIPGRKAIVEYKGERYVCPIRILWRIKKECDGRGSE